MANPRLTKLEHLKNEKGLVQQNEDLNAIVPKFTNGQEVLNMLLGNQKYNNGRSDIGFSDSSITCS